MIFNASGCLDALEAPEVARALDVFVTKTVTPQPREGNRPVRIAETEAGMLNSIGLENPGIEGLLADKLPRLAELGVPLWVSVGGFAASDYAELCAALDDRAEVAAIELNLSCPNVEEAPESAAEIVAAARRQTPKAALREAFAGRDRPPETARAVQAAGADGLSLVNTMRGLALDEQDAPAAARPRDRRLLRARPEADRAGGRLPVLPRDRDADRRHGRHLHRPRCPRVSRRRRGRRSRSERSSSPTRTRPAECVAELASELASRGLSTVEDATGLAHAPARSLLPDLTKLRFCGKNALFARVLEAH